MDDTQPRPITDGLIQALRERRDAGETVAGLAEKVGMPRTSLSALINGRRTNITLDTADRIAAELGLRLMTDAAGGQP